MFIKERAKVKCVKCNAEMKNVDLHGFAGSFPYLAFKEKHLIGEEKEAALIAWFVPTADTLS